MTVGEAQRLCEVGLGCAVVQQSLEHLFAGRALEPMRVPMVNAGRLVAAVALIAGLYPAAALPAIAALGFVLVHRFDGPFNGGSDRLCLLLAVCLSAARVWPAGAVPSVALAYLAVQTSLSYALAGWAKWRNPAWRTGAAVDDVLRYSIYPADERMREIRRHRALLRWLGRAVVFLELAFPLTMLHPVSLRMALVCAAAFHVGNAVVLGLNRFVWVWLATYPALVWFQSLLPLPWNAGAGPAW